jgi:hypothetical protein
LGHFSRDLFSAGIPSSNILSMAGSATLGALALSFNPVAECVNRSVARLAPIPGMDALVVERAIDPQRMALGIIATDVPWVFIAAHNRVVAAMAKQARIRTGHVAPEAPWVKPLG